MEVSLMAMRMAETLRSQDVGVAVTATKVFV